MTRSTVGIIEREGWKVRDARVRTDPTPSGFSHSKSNRTTFKFRIGKAKYLALRLV